MNHDIPPNLVTKVAELQSQVQDLEDKAVEHAEFLVVLGTLRQAMYSGIKGSGLSAKVGERSPDLQGKISKEEEFVKSQFPLLP